MPHVSIYVLHPPAARVLFGTILAVEFLDPKGGPVC